MLRLTEIKLPLDHAGDAVSMAILARLGLKPDELIGFTVFRRGVDARKRSAIHFTYTLDIETTRDAELLVTFSSDPHVMETPDTSYQFVVRSGTLPSTALRPVVVGTGPCGILAALVLAQMGLRPLILERGKAVRERTRDTWGFWQKGTLDPESNVQFGEGGAGTFSDGKLYSQIKDPRHYGRKVLHEFVKAGAPEEILYVSKPHIGTFRLVKMVEHMRASIEALGGEFRFSSKVDDVLIEDGEIRGLTLAGGEQIRADHVILAIGHSARDTFEMLHARGVYIEAKPFSIGCRIEHPQSLIDRARYGSFAGHPLLGAADYKLVHHARNGRSVYSFCMCPGGTVVAAASEPGRLVTNGMSQYSRDERNANSAIVVGITPEDYPGSPLAGIAFQRLCDLAPALPDFALVAMREAIPAFDKQLRGFNHAGAVLTAIETRTSSPIRIRRNEDDLQSLNTRGLFPAGEGAGYAGGILSAAVDGIRVAEALALSIASAGSTPRQSDR